MANIKLGAIITDIAGSVGGSTFRRTPAGIILYNKQGTQIKSAFAKNSVKNKLGNILSMWNTLQQSDKDFWNEKATLYTFPDKFGTLKNLTGRQLFTKLNTQLIPSTGLAQQFPWADTIYGGVINNITAILNGEVISFEFSEDIYDSYVFIRIYPIRQKGSAKPRLKSVCTFAGYVDGVNSVNIFSEFVNQYPLAIAGDWFGVNINVLTPSGFSNSVLSSTFELVP